MRTAYKAFNQDLTCTLGRGTFHYEPGKWYEEEQANCIRNGFHCAANPLDTMNYYRDWDKSQYWMVEIDGDIDEDGTDTKISATKIRLAKKLNLMEFVAHAMMYIYGHPALKMNQRVQRDEAKMSESDKFVIVRGENPKAMGVKEGQIIGLIKEVQGAENKIEAMGMFEIDGREHRTGTWYDVDGKGT